METGEIRYEPTWIDIIHLSGYCGYRMETGEIRYEPTWIDIIHLLNTLRHSLYAINRYVDIGVFHMHTKVIFILTLFQLITSSGYISYDIKHDGEAIIT